MSLPTLIFSIRVDMEIGFFFFFLQKKREKQVSTKYSAITTMNSDCVYV